MHYHIYLMCRVKDTLLDAVADTAKDALTMRLAEIKRPLQQPNEYTESELKEIFDAFRQCIAERDYYRQMLQLVRTLVSGYEREVGRE